jgi:hypothetical protein
MAEPATDANDNLDDIFNGMTLQMAHAEGILGLILASEPDELMGPLQVIREKLGAAQKLAEELYPAVMGK